MKKTFDEVFFDNTKLGTKVPTNEYSDAGKYIIVDQGRSQIAGYTDKEQGVFKDVPVIIFGDHTRVIKYVDRPFFLGADGTKVLKSKFKNANYKYLFYALKNVRIPNTGYNRHFKWLKMISINYPSLLIQSNIAVVLDTLAYIIECKQRELELYDELIKARFIEVFGESDKNTKQFPVRKLNEISSYWNGLTYKPVDTVEDGNGTLVLRSSNIQNGVLAFDDNVYVSCDIKEKLLVQDNDILMCSRNGSAALVGKTALIKGLVEPTTFGAFMMIIRSEYYSYLKTYFEMPFFRSQISTGTSTINQITGKMLNEISLPVPDIGTVKVFEEFVNRIAKSKLQVYQYMVAN